MSSAHQTQPTPTANPLLCTTFTPAQLLSRFQQLLPPELLDSWLALAGKKLYKRAFTPVITLWYCVFQRLGFNSTLSQVVEDAREGGADHLSPADKPLSKELISESTSSYSDARQRLPTEILRQTVHHTATSMAATLQIPKFFGLLVALLDGTTSRMRSLGDIPEEFPPHRPGNCKKDPYWCLVRVVGLICLATGCALDCVLGTPKVSEQALSLLLFRRSWQGWLLVGDRNFGVYSVVRAAVAVQAQVLVRLTQVRAAKLARAAGHSLVAGLDVALEWCASPQDQCPAELSRDSVPGRLLAVLIERPGFRPVTLYLFTTLTDTIQCPAQELAGLYGQRWQIELCFRYLKTQMDLGFLDCKSAQMAQKEWLAGLIAYNLIRWTMAVAAATAKVAVSKLSFSRTRELLAGWCLRSAVRGWTIESWERLLVRIAKARLPQRRKLRPSEPRAVRPFQKDVAKLFGSRAEARERIAKENANS